MRRLTLVNILRRLLTLSQTSVCSTSLLKTLRKKEKLLVTSNFSFSHSDFYPFWRTFRHFRFTKDYRLQVLSIWKGLKFVVWERVKAQFQRARLVLWQAKKLSLARHLAKVIQRGMRKLTLTDGIFLPELKAPFHRALTQDGCVVGGRGDKKDATVNRDSFTNPHPHLITVANENTCTQALQRSLGPSYHNLIT